MPGKKQYKNMPRKKKSPKKSNGNNCHGKKPAQGKKLGKLPKTMIQQ
jgi:hypothetical protein